MKKITLKEYKELSMKGFATMGYYNSIGNLPAALDSFKPVVKKENFKTPTMRSKSMFFRSETSNDNVYEDFHTGSEYFMYETNGNKYLIHSYSDINQSIKLIKG